MLDDAQTNLVLQWREAQAALRDLKVKESVLRDAVLKAVFKDETTPGQVLAGTSKVEIGYGYGLKAGFTLTYKIKKAADDTYNNVVIALGSLPRQIAEKLVRWTPDLSMSVYKTLTPEQRTIIDTVLEIKQGSSSLEMIEPKG